MATKDAPGAERPRSFIEQARRAQILQAAAETVAGVGFARASLARIAEQAGVSKGVVTYHFANKDELLRLMVSEFFEQGWAYMEPRVFAETTAIGRVRAWVAAEHEFFGTHRTQFLAMIQIVTNHRDDDGRLAHEDELNDETVALAQVLQEGQQTGELRDFDPVSYARIILRASEGVLGAWAEQPNIDLPAQTATLLDFITHALARHDTTEKTT